jgi:hypothetical protein
MDSGRTQRMRRLIRWGRQVLAPLAPAGAAVGTIPRGACGQPTASRSPPVAASIPLASAVRVQEDSGKSTSRASRGG